MGKIVLPKLGSLDGNVSLVGNVSDFAGIRIYVPGTSYAATSDASGNYSISGVPPGIHNLYFEKDGFGRGQIEGVEVASDQVTTVDQMSLSLDTGETGTFAFANATISSTGKPFVSEPIVDLSVLPSNNAVLMLIRPEWTEGLWKPVNTNYSIDFPIQEYIDYKNLTSSYEITYLFSPFKAEIVAKFANTNGLESDLVKREIHFDLFSDGTAPYEQQFDVVFNEAESKYVITNMNFPEITEGYKLQVQGQGPYSFPDTWSVPSEVIEHEIEDTIKQCGDKRFSFYLNALDGRLQYAGYSYSGLVPPSVSNGKIAAKDCFESIAETTFLANADDDNEDRYFSYFDGSRLLVLGWDDDQSFTFASYDPSSDAWTQLATTGNVPTLRSNANLFHVGNKLVIYGGTDDSYNTLYDIYFYDISSDQWLADPTGLVDLSNDQAKVVSNDDTLVVFTQFWSGENVLYAQKYNPTTHAFAAAYEITTLSTLGHMKCGVPHGDKILVFCSEDRNYNNLLGAYLFDPDDDSFTPVADIPSTKTSVNQVIRDQNKIIIDNWIYDKTGMFWSTINFTDFNPEEEDTFFVDDDTLMRNSWGASVSFYSISRDKVIEGNPYYFADYDDPRRRRWESYNPLIKHFIPGHGYLIWGGKYSYWDNSTEIVESPNDGFFIKHDFTKLWDD